MNRVVLGVALSCGLPFAAFGVAMHLLFVPAIAYAGRPLGIGATDVLKVVGTQVITALSNAALGFLLSHTVFVDILPLARPLVLSVLCGAVYLGTMIFGFRMTRPLAISASLIRRRDTSQG